MLRHHVHRLGRSCLLLLNCSKSVPLPPLLSSSPGVYLLLSRFFFSRRASTRLGPPSEHLRCTSVVFCPAPGRRTPGQGGGRVGFGDKAAWGSLTVENGTRHPLAGASSSVDRRTRLAPLERGGPFAWVSGISMMCTRYAPIAISAMRAYSRTLFSSRCVLVFSRRKGSTTHSTLFGRNAPGGQTRLTPKLNPNSKDDNVRLNSRCPLATKPTK